MAIVWLSLMGWAGERKREFRASRALLALATLPLCLPPPLYKAALFLGDIPSREGSSSSTMGVHRRVSSGSISYRGFGKVKCLQSLIMASVFRTSPCEVPFAAHRFRSISTPSPC